MSARYLEIGAGARFKYLLFFCFFCFGLRRANWHFSRAGKMETAFFGWVRGGVIYLTKRLALFFVWVVMNR